MKSIKHVIKTPPKHWVGDGFPVHSLLFYGEQGNTISPFLLADLAGPAYFEPSDTPRGVGQHPHRGFETVTLVYKGEVAHKDSAGNGGVITPGGVQWMTAGSGIVHEEFHSQAFTQKGGDIEMIQLWVNLPAKDKMTKPAYQEITKQDIPTLKLNEQASLRIIAGNYNNTYGPASTFSNIDLMDMHIDKGGQITLTLKEHYNSIVIVRHGNITINTQTLPEKYAAILSQEETDIEIKTDEGAQILILSGQPLNEPIEGYGPFVMNTKDEIRAAIHDYNAGKFR